MFEDIFSEEESEELEIEELEIEELEDEPESIVIWSREKEEEFDKKVSDITRGLMFGDEEESDKAMKDLLEIGCDDE
jgi:hypothetical protein